MPHGFLAINVFARLDGLQGYWHMQPVGCGDTHDVHRRVGQQMVLLHARVSLGPGGLRGFIEAVTVGIADGDDLQTLA